MARWETRLAAALVLIILAAGSTWAVDSPRYKMAELNRVADLQRQAGGPDEFARDLAQGRSFGTTISVASGAANSPGSRVGETTYDYQHNGSTGRQLDEFGGVIQVNYMRGTEPSLAIGRTIFWNKLSVDGSPEKITLDNGDSLWRFPLGDPQTVDGTPAISGGVRPGYTNFRNLPTGRGIGFFHDAPDEGPGSVWLASVDNGVAVGVWQTNFAPQPVDAIPGQEMIWPKGAVDLVGGETVLHAIAFEFNVTTDQRMYYWRGVVSGASVTWADPVLMDSISVLSPVIEADPTSDDVTMVYTHPRELGTQINNDLVYRRSTNGGLDWGPQVNITNYTDDSTNRAYTDLDAVYDEDGTFHVVFNTLDYDTALDLAAFQPADLIHWNDLRNTQRLILTAEWENECSSSPFNGGTFNLLVAKPSLIVKPAGDGPGEGIADELIYAVWTQFGPTDSIFQGNDTLFDCATQDSAGTIGGYTNGELWCSVSSNDGLTWDRPTNITGTQTPDCLPGDCNSEHWVSAAARADSGVYLSYTDDSHAGGIPQDEGQWSVSPYRVLAIQARTPVLEPRIGVTPQNFVELNVGTGATETVTVSVNNLGNSNLTFEAVVTADNGGPSHVLVNGGGSYNSSIAAAGAPEILTIEFDGIGLPDPSEHDWRLEITSNDPANDPGQGGSAINVNLNVFVADTWYICRRDTISTGLHRLAVGACLDLGDQGVTGGLYNYSDSAQWLYSASPVIVKRNAGGTVKHVYRNVFWNSLAERSRDSNVAFRAQSEITVQRGIQVISGDDTLQADVASGIASSTDSTLRIDWEAYAVQTPEYAQGAVTRYTITPGPVSDGLSGFLELGALADVDIDSSSGANLGLASESKQYVGGQGGVLDTNDVFLPEPLYAALFYVPLDDSCKDVAAGGYALDNQWYVYDNSEGGGQGAFNSDTLYKWMVTDLVGWNASTFPPDSLTDGTTDVNVLMKDRTEAWTESETLEFAFGVAVSNVSVSDLESTIARLRSVVNSACIAGCPIVLTGDVNLSGAITSADIIYLVNFVFKGQQAPQPCDASGDVNCSNSVTSADIIYLVNFVFKGQAPPCDGCTSVLAAQC